MRLDYASYLRNIFGDGKVQKISINAGFSCPNRDGTLGTSGCIYCDNSTFSPSYCMAGADVRTQLSEGIKFFGRKYPSMRYLAYFQSYTNTYRVTPEKLMQLYSEVLDVDGVVGIVVGTRPDTLFETSLDVLEEINHRAPVLLEIGAETSCDETLRLIRRGHTWQHVVDAVQRATDRNLRCGLHLIAGLPGESRQRSLQSIEDACTLPIDSIKLHQLQIVRDTPLHRLWENGKIDVQPFELEEYVDFCIRAIQIIPEHIVIDRFLAQSPPQKVVAPKWGIKNYQFVNLLNNRLKSEP